MGLDITAYKALRHVQNPELDADGYPTAAKQVRLCANSDFPGRIDGIHDGGVYETNESMMFRAGSYGGYNAWREQLAKLAGYSPTPFEHYGKTDMLCSAAVWNGATGPFSELIKFSDCEGVIGPVVAKKLTQDFAEFDERAKALDGYFYELYTDWRKAFEMAAEHGAVDFH